VEREWNFAKAWLYMELKPPDGTDAGKMDRVKTLFEEALQRDPGARQAFLVQACPEDDVRTLVENLILSHAKADNFLINAAWAGAGLQSQSEVFANGDLLADRFQITRLIAKGGMGEVYEARDLELKEDVAIKAIRPEILSHRVRWRGSSGSSFSQTSNASECLPDIRPVPPLRNEG